MERPSLSVHPSHVSSQKILDGCGRILVLVVVECLSETSVDEFSFGYCRYRTNSVLH
jgi:hypothetical protein